MTAVCFIPGCYGMHSSIASGNDSIYAWASISCCNVCKHRGYICTTGCFLRRAFDSRKQMTRHNYKHHLTTAASVSDHPFTDVDIDSQTDEVVSHCEVPPIVLHSTALQSFLEQSSNHLQHGTLLAIRRYIATACLGSSILSSDVVEGVPIHQAYTVLLLARLVFRIGSVNQALLSSLLSVIGPSSLPITRAQILSIITNPSKRTSIVSMIPTPRPIEFGSRHAYLALEEVIGHALGLQPAQTVILDKYQRLMNTPCGKRCLSDAQINLDTPDTKHLRKIICCLTYWFDGWDPNSSMSKANKTPIWSGTVTLIFCSLEGKVEYVTTRLVTSGPGKADHTEVIQSILENIQVMQQKTLTRKFWVRRFLDYALVYPSVLFVTCDQPERRSISGLLAGNSKLHSCFGVSCHTGQLSHTLESCAGCVAQIESYVDEAQFQLPFTFNCEICLQWTLPSLPGCFPRFEYIRVVDTSYPDDCIAGPHVNTHASMITTTLLKQAWDEAYDKWVVLNQWTVKQVEAYFKVLTINDATTVNFVNQGRRCQLAAAFRNDPNIVSSPLLRRELEAAMEKHPSNYTKPLPPPMWDIVQLDHLPEAIMHLAMGVVKAVAKFIHGWASARNKSPYLAERLNFCINMHRRYCRIGRCPMATYSQLGKFPGWVADTFRSWWIWMPWFYSILENPSFQYTRYIMPATPPSDWNGAVCAQFLKSRGYPGYSKLNAKEKQKVVLDMSVRVDWPLPEVIPSACGVTGLDLQTLVWHCHSLFKHMFAEPYCQTHLNAADSHVKLLLSTITKLDRLMQVHENQPNLYETKYNFISLPRAVRLMGIYGSARNIQEGGLDGEGVVKILRPLTPRGLKQHFAKNLINAFHRDKQLSDFCEELGAEVKTASGSNTSAPRILQQLIDCEETELTATDDAMYNGDESKEDVTLEPFPMSDRMTVDETQPLVIEEEDMSFALDGQQYKKYKSMPVLQELHELGLPLSFVIAQINDTSRIGCVVGNGNTGSLVPVCIGRVRENSKSGFTYFEITLVKEVGNRILLYSQNCEGGCIEHYSVLNYGHFLPHLASLGTMNENGPIPYAVVTTDAIHMNEFHSFV